MDPSLHDPLRLDEAVLKFFRSNVLSLGELKDVLGSVNNLD
jgi:hypothetical protein